MQRVIYVEGDTERVILKKVLGVHPKVEIFNPWQHKIEGKLRKLETTARKVEITILYDADLSATTNAHLFLHNLKLLRQQNYLSGLVQQTHNLEDEIVKSCSRIRSIRELYDYFGVAGQDEFKANLCQMSNPAQKLQDAGFDPAKLWRGELIEALEGYRAYHKTVDYLLKQRK
ncbi:hypothetical protein [Eikenella corrodens]|uniref:hypothetical protein n=2 Tax=Eikenella corrodens TaxID=539 RepID=UPI0012ACD6E7|nr:hypothetical protein [Eikenella corrodens]